MVAALYKHESQELHAALSDLSEERPSSNSGWPRLPITPDAEGFSMPSSRQRIKARHRELLVILAALLVVTSTVLIPVLFSPLPSLTSTADQGASVGQVAFTSSGQLDPTSTLGLDDTVTLRLHSLSMPPSGKDDVAWLLPDKSDRKTKPLLLGKLAIMGGTAQLTYVQPAHENLLARYSRFLVTEQNGNVQPTMPSPDTDSWRAIGSIPDIPTPGDEMHYSLLSHIRHLLAEEPMLQQIGLAGGMDIWLYRNTEKILEWSSAARDSWAGGQQTDLIHRHMIRVLDYLDGATAVYSSGDVPADSPLLVDPRAGKIGLLEVSPTQGMPAYIPHVDLHLQAVANAPGHTREQEQLALKIHRALILVSESLQTIRQDAVKLVNMDEMQLSSNEALALLDEMVTNATTAYVGQFDPKTGGNINGVVWVHNELQGLATLPVTAVATKKS